MPPDPSAALPHPDQLGPYKIERELARGGMGAVYAVTHAETGGAYVLKCLLPFAGADALDRRERFRREAQLMAQLDHPHIARVHTAELGGATPFLVQDLLSGGTLQDRLRQGPLPIDEALRITTALGAGLTHAHERGVLHRDLKPLNVVFDEHDQPQLVDFGLALTLEDHERLTQTGAVLGTPGYMAPEQARGDKRVDRRTDVYGLGAVLYAMLTGLPPFQGGSLLALLNQIVAGEPRPPSKANPQVPGWLNAACLRALARDPDERFPDMPSFTAALAGGALAPQRSLARAAGVALAGAALLVSVALSSRLPTPAPPGATPTPTARPSPSQRPSVDASPTDSGRAAAPPPWFLALPQAERPKLPEGVVFSTRPGQYVNTVDGTTLVWVPGGLHALSPASPRVHIPGFFLGRTEITWRQYRAFCKAHRRSLPSSSRDDLAAVNGAQRPARGLSWDEARAYCAWAGGRLPAEDEWSLAARGATSAARSRLIRPRPVGTSSEDRSVSGCLDMARSVSEWVGATVTLLDARQGRWLKRTQRGSSFRQNTRASIATRKQTDQLDQRPNTVGLRLCRPASPEPATLLDRDLHSAVIRLWTWAQARSALVQLDRRAQEQGLRKKTRAQVWNQDGRDSFPNLAERFRRGNARGMAELGRAFLHGSGRIDLDESLGLWLLFHAARLEKVSKAPLWLGRFFEATHPELALTCYEFGRLVCGETKATTRVTVLLKQHPALERMTLREARQRFERLSRFWIDAAPR